MTEALFLGPLPRIVPPQGRPGYRGGMDSEAGSDLDRLGEDLVLMSLAEDGRIVNRKRIGFGLMGSELVRLAAGGRVTIESNRVVVRDRAPCGDAELDAALASLAGSGRGARPKAWVGHPRPGICDAYLDRLATAGAVRPEQVERLGIFPVTRWRVADPARLASARARLDEVALSDAPVSTAQAAYAGLAHAVGLPALLYRGWDNRHVRKRLERIAKGEWAAVAVSAASQDATAASQAAISAAHQAAVAAAVDAATAAAVQAAVGAAQQAMADGGGA
jgi:hypothetical protein